MKEPSMVDWFCEDTPYKKGQKMTQKDEGSFNYNN